MEYQKITNLWGNISDKIPKFITKKWVKVHDQSGDANYRYKPSKQIRFKRSLLQSDLCDYSDPYIVVVTDAYIAAENPNNDACDKKLALKNDG